MKRDDHIKVYLNEKEQAKIKEAAKQKDRSVSNYARNKIKEALPVEVEA